jgi:enterobactin synthetase component D
MGTKPTCLSESGSLVSTDRERTYEQLFDLQLPEGRCVGLRWPEPTIANDSRQTSDLSVESIAKDQNHWIYNVLHVDEVAFGLRLSSEATRQSFFIGRLAIRHALDLPDIGDPNCCVLLKDEYGRPQLPPGYLGSISHKRSVGVALVAPDPAMCNSGGGEPALRPGSPQRGIGVDIEGSVPNPKSNIAQRVLTARERNELGRIEGISAAEEVLLRFSIKESLYKAMHPLICQYVGFQDAEVRPLSSGTVEVHLTLPSGAHTAFDSIQAHWRREGDFFLTSAAVTRPT